MTQLIPSSLEYLFLLAIYFLIVTTLFWNQVQAVLKTRSFWISALVFAASWTGLEIYGLRAGIWSYSTEKLCGLAVVGVPIEEYVAFLLIHLATCSSWEAFDKEP